MQRAIAKLIQNKLVKSILPKGLRAAQRSHADTAFTQWFFALQR